MKQVLTLVLVFLTQQVSAQIQDEIVLFNSLYGTTGNILTSNAYTVGKFKGNIGVFENFDTDFEDNLIFNFGVHEKIEIGIQSEIPTHPNPTLNFFFKLRANEQGEYFGLKNKCIPVTAFGINRDNAFAVASYNFKLCQISIGYNFSDDRQSFFTGLNLRIIKEIHLQVEYVDNTFSGGLRIRYKGITAGMVYYHPLDMNTFDDKFAFWEISYNFK